MKKIWITWEYRFKKWDDPDKCSICNDPIYYNDFIIKADNGEAIHGKCKDKVYVDEYISEVFPDTKPFQEDIIFPLPFA